MKKLLLIMISSLLSIWACNSLAVCPGGSHSVLKCTTTAQRPAGETSYDVHGRVHYEQPSSGYSQENAYAVCKSNGSFGAIADSPQDSDLCCPDSTVMGKKAQWEEATGATCNFIK